MRRILVSMVVLLLVGVMFGVGSLRPTVDTGVFAQTDCTGDLVTHEPDATPVASPAASSAHEPELLYREPVGAQRAAFDLLGLLDPDDEGNDPLLDYRLSVGAFCLADGGTVNQTTVGALVLYVTEGSITINVTRLDPEQFPTEADTARAATKIGTNPEELNLPPYPDASEPVTLGPGNSIRVIDATIDVVNETDAPTRFIAVGLSEGELGCPIGCWLP